MTDPMRPRHQRRTRRWAGAAALVAVGLLAAACGDDGDVGTKPDLPTEPPALWNPCDALDTTFVEEQFGARTTKEDGTPTAPDCRFVPEEGSGDPVLDANYQLFGGSLDEFWEQMGQGEDADVRQPAVPGADAARIVVAAEEDQLYVTGFVQNGMLFEVVNLVDPAPYDEERAVRGMRAALEALTRHADENGAGEPASTAPSPSS